MRHRNQKLLLMILLAGFPVLLPFTVVCEEPAWSFILVTSQENGGKVMEGEAKVDISGSTISFTVGKTGSKGFDGTLYHRYPQIMEGHPYPYHDEQINLTNEHLYIGLHRHIRHK